MGQDEKAAGDGIEALPHLSQLGLTAHFWSPPGRASEFVNKTYLPWARANKRSSCDDEIHASVFCLHFGKESLSEIDQQMIEEFKVKRTGSITRNGRTRRSASVNRELAILSGISGWPLITKR